MAQPRNGYLTTILSGLVVAGIIASGSGLVLSARLDERVQHIEDESKQREVDHDTLNRICTQMEAVNRDVTEIKQDIKQILLHINSGRLEQ